ncbi:MAG: AraC family transcriptional regulator [Pseudomonadales bacterium]|nr:AraC family transcriptional regulator [Pseudomonadales bacterium]
MDALSHILDDIHLSRAEYVYVMGKGFWGFALKDHAIFHIALNGPVRLYFPTGEDHLLQTGDIAFVPAGVTHQVGHPEAKVESLPWLMDEFQGHRNEPISVGNGAEQGYMLTVRCLMDEEMGRPLLSALPTCMLIRQGLDGNGPEWLQLGLSFLAQETESLRPGRDTLINRLIGMFLIECVRDYIEQLPDSTDNWLSALSDPYLSQALSAIHSQPDYPWTVVELARRACLSRSAFHDRFAEVIGMPPLAYLTEHRLRLAARLLAQADLNISRISARVGYKSEAAFSQAFRRQYQVTPSVYRKRRVSL